MTKTLCVAEISHGKDSNAMLHVINDILHLPLDMICTTDVWFDDDTRAELPPMVAWKEAADKIILEKWGIPVTHLCATNARQKKATYKDIFYRPATPNAIKKRVKNGAGGDISIYGFAQRKGNYCTAELKKLSASHLYRAVGVRADSKRKTLWLPNIVKERRELVYSPQTGVFG